MTDVRRDDDALNWAVRTSDPAFDDWEGFQAWFEADPTHAARYHAVCDDVGQMAELLGRAQVRPVEATLARRPMSPWARPRWAAGGLAALVIASVGYVAADRWPQPFTIETKPGVTRMIALADGSSVALNGGTRVVLDRKDARVATLERGEVMVSVRHDAARPFRVTVGGNTVVDIGTKFSVTRDDGVTRVAVSEGEIAFDPHGADVRLHPGQSLTSVDASHEVVVTRVDQSSVGAWRRNQLVYDGTPLRLVAADLSRRLGTQIVAAPDVAARPFRGTIATVGLSGSPETLAPLLDVTLRRSGTVWTMTGRQ